MPVLASRVDLPDRPVGELLDTLRRFDGAESREVSFPAGANTMTLKGQQFLSNFAVPNFYFHAATAHGILRHNGVEIGKRDFLGVR